MGEVDWTMVGSWIYLLFVISIIAMGLYGWNASRQMKIV
jgi:hypothetical protein